MALPTPHPPGGRIIPQVRLWTAHGSGRLSIQRSERYLPPSGGSLDKGSYAILASDLCHVRWDLSPMTSGIAPASELPGCPSQAIGLGTHAEQQLPANVFDQSQLCTGPSGASSATSLQSAVIAQGLPGRPAHAAGG